MKAKLTFKLPKDQMDYDLANAAQSMASFMWEFQNYLRQQWKYDGKDDIEAIYNKWFEMMGEENIDLDKLIQ